MREMADALHAAEDEGVQCTANIDELDEESLTGQDAVITELERSSFIEPLRKGNDEGHVEYAAPHLVNSMGVGAVTNAVKRNECDGSSVNPVSALLSLLVEVISCAISSFRIQRWHIVEIMTSASRWRRLIEDGSFDMQWMSSRLIRARIS